MKPMSIVKLCAYGVVFSVFSFVTSCEPDAFSDEEILSEDFFFEEHTKVKFDLSDQSQLNEVAKSLTKENDIITLVKDAKLLSLSDSKGDFKVISVTYKVKGLITKLSVPLAEVSTSDASQFSANGIDGNARYYMAAPCEMKCTTGTDCTACKQEIIERCVSQTCSCDSGSGGCTASIVFQE